MSKKSGKTKRSPAKSDMKASTVLKWTDAMVCDLMTPRYETHSEKFNKAKNNAGLKAAWLLLATKLSDNHQTSISTEQCKIKIKWLKKKWAEYNADVRATGNFEIDVLEPPGIEIMQTFGAGSPGTNGRTLAGSEADGAAVLSDEDAFGDVDGDNATNKSEGSRKKRKTMVESIESDMQSIANGFEAMAAAMAPPPAPTTDNRSVEELSDSRFNTMLQRQDAQLEQMRIQNQQLSLLIAAPHKDSNK